jgi:predicted Zn-ribbon and HTH transcriptional regulator
MSRTLKEILTLKWGMQAQKLFMYHFRCRKCGYLFAYKAKERDPRIYCDSCCRAVAKQFMLF